MVLASYCFITNDPITWCLKTTSIHLAPDCVGWQFRLGSTERFSGSQAGSFMILCLFSGQLVSCISGAGWVFAGAPWFFSMWSLMERACSHARGRVPIESAQQLLRPGLGAA